MLNKIEESINYIKSHIREIPAAAIVLGSGLGDLAGNMEHQTIIPYEDIPHFKHSTVSGHKGNLIFGRLNGVLTAVMQGRFHFYEGYDMEDVTFPVRVLLKLGIRNLILSNAAGGLNESFSPGDLMLISDHINLFPQHPLRGKNDERLGVRFPDMSHAYNRDLRNLAKEIALQEQITLKEGVYVGTQGPTYETPAESRFFRMIGGDAVGMSTVPEVIVAAHMNVRCVAFSVITNTYKEGITEITTHNEVESVADAAKDTLKKLVEKLIRHIA